MKREEIKEILKDLNPSNDVIDKIMSINGADINAVKDVLNGNISSLQSQIADRDKDIADLKKTAGDNADLNKKFEELQSKYDTETAAFKAQIEKRDYTDALRTAISDNKIKFTSKAAEKYFYSEAESKKMKLENGKLTGFDDFYKSQKEADASAFVADDNSSANNTNNNKGMRFLGGAGSTQGTTASLGAQMAMRYNSQHSKNGTVSQSTNQNNQNN